MFLFLFLSSIAEVQPLLSNSKSNRTSPPIQPISHNTRPSTMAVFPQRKYPSTAQSHTLAARYRSALARHPFALFGLPFIATMLLGSFFLTPATALRYERYDRKVRQLTKEEELGIGKDRRKVDLSEEYYVSLIDGGFGERLDLLTGGIETRGEGSG